MWVACVRQSILCSTVFVKNIILFALALCGTPALGQTAAPPPAPFTGVWKVELHCRENYCQGPTGITEQTTGGVESQTWTVTQQANTYRLSMGQNQSPLEKGVVSGNELRFSKVVSGTDASSAQQVILSVDAKGRLTGKLNIAPKSPAGTCIKRYTLTGRQ